ncbi:accessory gene regulator AgrC [Clostridium novyi A str. NCTC 538]|uniref:Accessory gene regulator protein C, putative n=2 Tax=Clostridium novyi TaxID=1542 RepID=A0Q0I3_CLONN|nr:accessory gene regulator protein C, putative [Clostridium novyi NT]KEH85437.1 accessory gene regulator AgrC [Clostridium novyi A str. NCTC 538]
MDILNIFLLFLNFYTYLYVGYKLMNYKFTITKKNSIIILIIAISHNFISKMNNLYHFKILLTFILLILLFKKVFNKDFFLIIETCFFTLIIMIFSEQLIAIILSNLLDLNLSYIISNNVLKFCSNILIIINNIFIINIHSMLWKYIKDKYFLNYCNSIIKNFFILMLTFILLISYLLLYECFNSYLKNKTFIFIFILCIFSGYLSLAFLYTNYLFNHNLIMLKIKEKKYNQLKIYSDSIENLIDDISSFKHDYNNIIFMMNGFLQNNDYVSLKNYFNKNVFKEKDYYDISKLKKIRNSGIKGLLSAKISQIIKNDIKVNIEIFDIIDNIYMSEFDLCRILGVFLDNALESAKLSSDKFISISFIKNEGLNITVLNSFANNNIKLNSIFKKGYSSKGSNRGMGLYNVHSILNEKYTENTILNTYVKNDMFIQDLYIKD